MATLDPDKLDEVIKSAGLGERSARKLRRANNPVEDDAPRGHGAPIQTMDSPPER